MKIYLQPLSAENLEIWIGLNDEMSEHFDEGKVGEEAKEMLRKLAFEKNPPFYAKILYVDGEVAGYFTYKKDYATWHGWALFLEDIFIREAYRGRGLGTKLFENCLEIAKEWDCKRFDWWTGLDNEKAQKFYEKMGAKRMDKCIYRLEF